MYPAPFEYFAPESVEEALTLLSQYGEDAKVLAGGQSLVPMMKLRIASPRCLIDVNRIKTMTGLSQSGDRLVLGAGMLGDGRPLRCRAGSPEIAPSAGSLLPAGAPEHPGSWAGQRGDLSQPQDVGSRQASIRDWSPV